MSVAFLWEPGALFLALEVRDDSHQNAGSTWDGDAVQLLMAPATLLTCPKTQTRVRLGSAGKR